MKYVVKPSPTLISLLIAALFLAYFGFSLIRSHPLAVPQTSVVPEQSRTVSPPTGQAIGVPSRLLIPSLGVDAPIVEVGLTPSGDMDVPSGPIDVGWYKFGPYPGQVGSAVLSGHEGWANGVVGVFDNIDKLRTGDKIVIRTVVGTSISFTVKGSKTYEPSAIVPDIFYSNSGSHLNIITCYGSWDSSQKTYNQRLVVFADKSN